MSLAEKWRQQSKAWDSIGEWAKAREAERRMWECSAAEKRALRAAHRAVRYGLRDSQEPSQPTCSLAGGELGVAIGIVPFWEMEQIPTLGSEVVRRKRHMERV